MLWQSTSMHHTEKLYPMSQAFSYKVIKCLGFLYKSFGRTAGFRSAHTTMHCLLLLLIYTALTEKSVHHALLLLIRTSDCMMTDAICRGSVLVASYCIPGLHVCNAIAVWDYVCMHVGGACMSVRTSAN